MPMKTVPFDAAEFLTTGESQAELLEDAFASGDAAYVAHALGVVARARGMTLSDKGDPRLSTLLGVVRALRLKLTVAPAPHEPA